MNDAYRYTHFIKTVSNFMCIFANQYISLAWNCDWWRLLWSPRFSNNQGWSKLPHRWQDACVSPGSQNLPFPESHSFSYRSHQQWRYCSFLRHQWWLSQKGNSYQIIYFADLLAPLKYKTCQLTSLWWFIPFLISWKVLDSGCLKVCMHVSFCSYWNLNWIFLLPTGT